MTTELLQKVIETVETLPIEEQKTILQRWLCELEEITGSQSFLVPSLRLGMQKVSL